MPMNLLDLDLPSQIINPQPSLHQTSKMQLAKLSNLARMKLYRRSSSDSFASSSSSSKNQIAGMEFTINVSGRSPDGIDENMAEQGLCAERAQPV